MIWCSGSPDFNVGGQARIGWVKLCAPLITPPAKLRVHFKSTQRLTRQYILLDPEDCDPPHGLYLTPGSRDSIKVDWLVEAFARDGFDPDEPALVGSYKRQNTISEWNAPS